VSEAPSLLENTLPPTASLKPADDAVLSPAMGNAADVEGAVPRLAGHSLDGTLPWLEESVNWVEAETVGLPVAVDMLVEDESGWGVMVV
jgi:hypothetical protein